MKKNKKEPGTGTKPETKHVYIYELMSLPYKKLCQKY